MTKQHTKSGKFAPGNSLGSGRPPLPETERKVYIAARIDPTLAQHIATYAETHGITKTDAIEQHLQAGIEYITGIEQLRKDLQS